MRILCLHDAHADARALQVQLSKLDERLWRQHGRMELVYVNAPLVVDASKGARAWWQASEDESDPYLGRDASLLLLEQMWKSGPAWEGVIGVGQGAAMGRLLAARLHGASCTRAPPQVAIWITKDDTTHDNNNNNNNNTNSRDDLLLPYNDKDDEEALLTSSLNALHLERRGNDDFSTPCLNRMGRHLVQHQTRQRRLQQQEQLQVWQPPSDNNNNNNNNNDHQVVDQQQTWSVAGLQDALAQVETEAAALVHRHVLAHPPSSLMAVIMPASGSSGSNNSCDAHMAAWQGPKRAAPAGGAPCPATFLLPQHKRGGEQSQALSPMA
jgi:hypothetical protein